MSRIHYGRVLLGGFAGGLVANVGDFVVNSVFMADDLARMAQRLNLDQRVIASPAVGLTWVAVDFVYVTLIVWTYAAIRPRFGPGPGTAVRAGVTLWAAVSAILYGFLSMGVFTPDSFLKSAAFTLATTVLASLAGAGVYKEREVPRA